MKYFLLSILRFITLLFIGGINTTNSYAIGGGVQLIDCNQDEQVRLLEAFTFLADRVTSESARFKNCIDNAYLVEHRDWTALGITRALVNKSLSKVKCDNLSDGIAANARHRVQSIESSESVNVDRWFIKNSNSSKIAAAIAHEFMHNRGFKHESNDFGSRFYSFTVPEQVQQCIANDTPNPWRGPGSSTVDPNNIAAIAIEGFSNRVYTWYFDGTVTAGSTEKLHSKLIPTRYSLPPGKTPADIVGIAIRGMNKNGTEPFLQKGKLGDVVYAFYRDGTVSAGSVFDLDSIRKSYEYKLPGSRIPINIVGISIDDSGAKDAVYAFYNDGTVSAGSTKRLGSRRSPSPFVVPFNMTAYDIVGIGIDGTNNNVFAWYTDKTVSAGTTENLFIRRVPKSYDTGR